MTEHKIPARNVPELRFSEFRDAGEWEETAIAKLSACSLSNGVFNDPKKVGTGYKLINVLDMYIDTAIVENKLYLIDLSKDEFKRNKVETGDILFTRSSLVTSGIAYSNIYLGRSDDITFDGHLIRFRPNKKKLIPTFANYLLRTKKVRSQLVARGKTATMTTIGQADVKSVKLSIPHINEQQKITDCLSSLDKLIAAQVQKVDTLKAYKKGMRQQLFPAEGETVPKLRFPEFRNAGEWEEQPLKKVFSVFQGFAFSSNDSVNEGVRWLKIADVSIQQMNHSAPSYLPIEYKEKYEKFSVKQGDYVIALTRPILSRQLKMAPVDNVFHGALLNQRVGKLVTAQNIAFVYFLLQTSKLISDIEKSISGSEPPNLSAQQIKDIKTFIPSEKEQQKIADCLSSLDELIVAHTQKLDTLKTHKKGLMQQLFPAINEVTG